ncbi:O-antigen ligase family protein [Candidatus Nomurabacteria bacterium]|nr:O-antigen ligase family protein [Candidatus Nomurabacteria bacterium]
MDKNAKIYVAGQGGLVGSALVRELKKGGYNNIITKTREELNLTKQDLVEKMDKNMNNIVNKIKNVTLEQFNKNLILLALVALIYRKGNFYNTFIPKPFEIILVLIMLLALIDLIKNKKFKDFFLSIDKKIWIALSCLMASIFVGWLVAVFLKNVPINLNVILEFGTFIISVSIFVLVLFYTKNDENCAKKYLYALLLPAGYIIFVLFPEWTEYLKLENMGTFLGFTMNPNIISKILLIPALFFITHSLFSYPNKWRKYAYVAISCLLVALLFWVASRGGLVSLVLSFIFVWLIFSFNNFNWKKLFYSGIIIFLIFLIGFIITPQTSKQRIFLKALYPSISDEASYKTVKDKSVTEIAIKFVDNTSNKHIFIYPAREDRFQIWPFYLRYLLENPFGIGPNTHLSFYLTGYDGQYLNSGPHNTFLQIWLWGGLLGILSFIYIFISAYKNLFAKLKSNFNPEALALLGILFALSVSVMFDDSLSFFWFFIILALALRYENTAC